MPVYFIQAGEGGPIKIGTARDVRARLAVLQTGAHETLRVLGTLSGGERLERALHQHLVAWRVAREWFSPVPEVIAAMTAPPSPLAPAAKRNQRRADPAALAAIEAVGGPHAMARKIGVRHQAVSQWRRIPTLRVITVEKVAGVPRHELRPDLYPPPDAATQATGAAA